MKRRIAIYFTGGTISMRRDPQTRSTAPTFSGEDLLDFIPGVRDVADVEVVDFGCLPGTQMTLPLMMELAARLRETLAESRVDGVVVTHGTDTLEETAYLVDLVVESEKPVVFVGAMYSSSEPEWDGASNLTDAARVAASHAARGLGTLVVMGGQVLAAGEATKASTESLQPFESPHWGPLGEVNDSRVTIRRVPQPRSHIDTAAVEPVWLIKVAVGDDSTLIDSCVDKGARGIVLEALGCGNVPAGCLPGIERALRSNIPVALASRCFRGRVAGRYDYVGGGAQLREMGVMSAGALNGQKARIRLSLTLGAANGPRHLREIFESS
ncbi:MAG: asparaginase [Pyrinomonadaceae bacterium]